MSFKDNYIKLSKKFGGPYALESKGLSMATITSIMRGSDIGVSKACKVAMVLGVTVEELIGEEVAKIPGVQYNNEEVKYIDKLVAVLRGHDEAKKATVKGVLDMARQDAWTKEQREAYKKTAM
jgi:transcriptional regulator with XRE-family HTH domain